MIKCEVLVDRCSLVVGKGSIVYVDERQFELARQFVKPCDIERKEETDADEEEPKKKSTKKK